MAAERAQRASASWSAHLRLSLSRVRPLQALIAVQLALLVITGVLTAVRFEFFSAIDETAHFDYVRVIAEERRLPVLGEDKMGYPVAALSQGLDPDARPRPEIEPPAGLPAESYQAFEPPLYYALMAPLLTITDDWSQRAKLVRLATFAFLLAAVAVVYRFARRVAPDAHLLVFSFALTVLLWPGIVVRSATVANASLELLLACALLYVLWRADELRDERRLLIAGVLLGLGLLTKLTLVALAPLLVVVAIRYALRAGDRRGWGAAALSLALPLVLLAPWVIFNLQHYDAFTPSALAKEMQESVVNPDGVTYTLGRFLDMVPRLFEGTLPQDWYFVDAPLIPFGLGFLEAAIFGLPVLLLLVEPHWLRTRHAGLLVAPFLLGIAMVGWVTLVENWPIASSRRLYAETPAVALFAAFACLRLFRTPGVALVLAAVFSLVLAVSWVDLSIRFLL
jgi:4-amino-4-deoxy-L-arabinose transferase-like glycosyltransferase